jgi:hypothetical protein
LRRVMVNLGRSLRIGNETLDESHPMELSDRMIFYHMFLDEMGLCSRDPKIVGEGRLCAGSLLRALFRYDAMVESGRFSAPEEPLAQNKGKI